jgi:HKD family nuclease
MQQGIYEEIISQLIQKKILDLDSQQFYIGTKILDPEEAAVYLSRYLNKVIYFAINNLKAEKRLDVGITLVNDIIRLVRDRFKLGEQDLNLLDVQGKLLTAIIDKTTCSHPDIAEYLKAITPYTRLTQSELFTGSNQSISLESEMKREIASSDEVCILVSFIKWTGLRGLQDDFLQFTESGKKLRVITTSYIGATDLKAVQFLAGLKNTEVKISYNNSNERLHAKAYLYLRKTGFDTGYIGSSNISHSALNRGLEWNIKITQAEIGHVIDKFHKTFETYWEVLNLRSSD